MKTVFDGSGTAKKRVILVLSGIIAALPFCFSRLYILSWLFFGVLYTFIFAQKNGRVKAGSLFCFFYPFYAVLYSWFVNLYPLDFAGLGAFASVLVIIAALTLIPLVHSAVMAFSVWFCVFLTKPNNSIVSSFVFAFSYVFGEVLQGVGSFAFPWGRLFVAQTYRLEIIQSASLFGSYFITFLIVLVNALAAHALFIKSDIKARVCYGAAALLLFVSNFAYGALKLSGGYDTDGEITRLFPVKSITCPFCIVRPSLCRYDPFRDTLVLIGAICLVTPIRAIILSDTLGTSARSFNMLPPLTVTDGSRFLQFLT